MFRASTGALFAALSGILAACHDAGPTSPADTTRTFRMGFANSAPRFDDVNLFVQSLDLWTARADAAIISTEVPWKELLDGESAGDYVASNYQDLVNYYRSKQLELWVYIDPVNGLDRSNDALDLQEVGKSISDSEEQTLYERFVVAMDSVIQPEHLGLALETNLVRANSSATIYNGMEEAVNTAAAQVKTRDTLVKLSVSIQVEQAWGGINGGGTFQGIQQDLVDFPFIEELGMSSYPYFRYDTPDEIPDNYYSRITEGTGLLPFVSEGGWTSHTLTAGAYQLTSSDETQAAYIRKQEQLLNSVGAVAWFQLTFTDIDLTGIPPDTPDVIQYFAYLGLVDTNFQPKAALHAWDEIFSLNFAAR